jgi:hypothetical protein
MASAARTRTAAGAAASTIKWAKVESWSAPAGSARGEDTPEALRSVGPSKPGGRHFLDETEIQCYTYFYSMNLAFGAVGRQKGENVRLRSLAQRLRPEENFLFGFVVTH